MLKYYPVMLNIRERKCVIVGGGNVAFRKAKILLDYGANIRIISEDICENIKSIVNLVEWTQRNYKVNDINGAFAVFIATNNNLINNQVYKEAKSKNILVNIVDEPELCDFIVPSIIANGDLTIAISTAGNSPLLAKKIAMDLEMQFSKYYSEYVTLLGELRQLVKENINDINIREKIYNELVFSDYLEKLKIYGYNSVKLEMIETINKYKNNE